MNPSQPSSSPPPPPPPPAFTTVAIRNAPDVSAKEIVEFIEDQFPFAKVRHCDRPEPSIGTFFLDLFDERAALRLCELAGPDRQLKLKGVALAVNWPGGTEPWRAVAARCAAAAQGVPPPGAPADGGRGRAPRDTASATGRVPLQPLPVTHLELVPVAAGLLALATLGTTLFLAKQGGHVAPGQFLVPISLWSNHAPASHVYALGLSGVGCLLLLTAWLLWPVFSWLGLLVPSHAGYCRTAAVTAFLAPCCMMIHSAVPLTPEFSLALAGRVPPASLQATVHQAAAGLFFLTGVIHCYAVVHLWDHLSGDDVPHQIRRQFPVTRFSYRQKRVALTCQALVPVANLLHPVAWSYLEMAMTLEHRLAAAALTQFVVVGALLFFFFSYSRDLPFLRSQTVLVGHPLPPRAAVAAADGDARKL